MLSGVGPADELSNHKIPVIKDLPVGYNLQDHVEYKVNFLFNESVAPKG